MLINQAYRSNSENWLQKHQGLLPPKKHRLLTMDHFWLNIIKAVIEV